MYLGDAVKFAEQQAMYADAVINWLDEYANEIAHEDAVRVCTRKAAEIRDRERRNAGALREVYNALADVEPAAVELAVPYLG